MPGVTRPLAALAAVTVLAAIVLVGLALGRNGSAAPRRATLTAATTGDAPAAPARTAAVATLPALPPADPAQLVSDLDLAHRVIDDPSSPPSRLASAGRLEQLTIRVLERMPRRARRSLIARLSPGAAATARTNLAAEGALTGIEPVPPRLPPWRIEAPLPAPALLGLFHAAGARYGVDWHDLAAIMLIETRFGRIHGPSTAGAQGPMQFMPSTWAIYGHGDIHDPRAAIPAAARFLAANGARTDLPGAIFHYNNSLGYVHAVQDYAARMRADPRTFLGYYEWQIIYADRQGTMILPIGFPRVRPIPLR